MLLRVRFLHVPLDHLLHHEIAVDLYIFDQLPVSDPPFPGNGEISYGRSRVDK
jgi:hypothetical protein